MGLIYSSSDSSQLISALQKNLRSGKEVSEQLKSGSQQVIAAVDGKTLSGAAYTAGKGLFSDLILPTISKVTSAIDNIESELQTYSSADALVSGEGILDEDKLMHQIATKKAMKASVDASAAVARVLSRNNPVAKVLDSLLNVQSNLTRMSNDFEDDIRELEKKVEKLHTFSSQTNGLFSNSLNDMKVAMQNCLILDNTIVNSDGSYSLPKGVDKSWFDQLKETSELNGLTGDKQPDVGNREYKLIDLGYGKLWMWVEKGKNFATSEDIDVTLAYNKWVSRMLDKYGASFLLGEQQEDFLETFLRQNANLVKELSTGIDSVTGKPLTTQDRLLKMTTLANSMLTAGVAVKGVVDVGKVKNSKSNTPKKASGAETIKQPNDFATEPFLPEEYYKNNRLPSRIEPGTSSLDKFDDLGNLKQTKFYDQYGREKGWIDYTDHGRPDSHNAPHWHEYIYDAEFPLGKKFDHKFDTNPPFSK